MTLKYIPKEQTRFGQQSFQQRQPFPQRQILNRTIIKDKLRDDLTINSILLKFTEGNVLDIKKTLGEIGLTINEIVDDKSKTVLHLILENENLTKEHKLELIRFLKTLGPLNMGFDENNITPLHIASNLQLTEIVDELLKSKHDPNSQDNSMKTPLHYAVVGKSVKQPLPDKPLISENKRVKIESDLIKKLTEELFKKISDNKNPFIDNIFNTIKNIVSIYNQDIERLLDSPDIKKKISNIIISPELKELDKQKRIQEILNQNKDSLIDFIKSKLTNTLSQDKFQQNTENGWSPNGPTDIPQNKIIEKDALIGFITELEQQEKVDAENLNKKFISVKNKINEGNEYFKKSVENLKELTNNGLWIEEFYKQLNQIIVDLYTVNVGDESQINPPITAYPDLNINYTNEFKYEAIVDTEVQIQPILINSDLIGHSTNANCLTNDLTDIRGGVIPRLDVLVNTDKLNEVNIDMNLYKDSQSLLSFINDYIDVQEEKVYVKDNNGKFLDPRKIFTGGPKSIWLEINQNYLTEINWILQNSTPPGMAQTLYDFVINNYRNSAGFKYMPYFFPGNSNNTNIVIYPAIPGGPNRDIQFELYDPGFVINNPIPGGFGVNHMTIFFNIYDNNNNTGKILADTDIYTNKYAQNLYKFNTAGHPIKYHNVKHLNGANYDEIQKISIKHKIQYGPGNQDYYFTKKYSVILIQLDFLSETLDTDLNEITTIINTNTYSANFENIYKMISRIIIKILELIINLKSLQDETNLIKIRLNYISNKLSKHIVILKNKLNSSINQDMTELNKVFNNLNLDTFYVEYKAKVDKYIKDFTDKLNSKLVDVFSNYTSIYESVNDIVEIYNKRSYIKYVKFYFNNLQLNNIINPVKLNTELVTDIYKYVINKIPKFSLSFDKLNDLFKISDRNPDTDLVANGEMKSKFIQTFLIQFLNNNYNLLYTATQPVRNARIGYIDLNTIWIYANGTPLPDIKYNIPSINIDLDNLDATRIGIVGYIAPIQYNKSDSILPIAGYDMDRFYTIYKTIFIRLLISEINQNHIIGNSGGNLQNLINKLRDDIAYNISNLQQGDNSLIYITIASILDRLYTMNMEEIIRNVSLKYIKKENVGDTYQIVLPEKYSQTEIFDINYDVLNKGILRNIRKIITNPNLDLAYLDDVTYKKNKSIQLVLPSSILDNSNKLYLQFNPSIIQLLLQNGAENHIRDKDGRNPFVNAIINTNAEAVEELLKQTGISVSTQKSTDNYGFTPLDIAVNQFEDIIGNFDFILNGSLESITDDINEEIKTKTQITHIMRYNELIFPMLIYLLNHHLYSISNQYESSNWTVMINKYFHEKVNGGKIDSIELLEGLNTETKTVYHFTDLKNLNQSYENKFQDKTDEYQQVVNQQYKLRKESNESYSTPFRKGQIINQGLSLRAKYGANPPRRELPYKRNNNKISRENARYKDDLLTHLNPRIRRSNDTIQLFDSIYNEILVFNPLDRKTYISLWEELLDSTIKKPSQIITNCLEKLKYFKDLKFNPKNKDILEQIILISQYLNIIHNLIDSYFTKPSIYDDENKELTYVMNIIIHVVKSTLSLNLYNVIQKLLKLHLENKFELDRPIPDRIINIDGEIKKILTDKIKNYIFDSVPQKIVKITLGIFESDEDPDKKLDMPTIFSDLNKMIIQNANLKDDSNIIKTLNDGVYPYFTEYFQMNITYMKKIVDSYYGMIHNLSKKIKILHLVLNKAKDE